MLLASACYHAPVIRAFFALSLLLPLGCANGLGPEALLERSDEDLETNRVLRARNGYRHYLKHGTSEPNRGRAMVGVGLSFFKLERYQRAARYFENTIANYGSTPAVWDALYYAGMAKARLGRCATASNYFAQLVEGTLDRSQGSEHARGSVPRKYQFLAQEQLDFIQNDMSGPHRFCEADLAH